MSYDNQKPGSGLVGKNKYFDAARRTPHMTGHVYAHRDIKVGERIELSLWKWQNRPDDGFTVRVGDPRSLSEEAYGEKPAPASPTDSDLPF
jgi:hypothetical protein